MKKLLLYLFIFVTVYSGQVPASVLTILTVNEPPSSYLDEEGKLAGFSVDIVQELRARTDNSDPIEIVPEVRAIKKAKSSPNVLLFSFSRTPTREQEFHWIMKVMVKPWVMYMRTDAGITHLTLDDARYLKSIGVVRGDVRAEHLRNKGFTNLIEVRTHQQNLKLLKKRRIDAIYYEPQGMAHLCRELEVSCSDFKSVNDENTSDIYILMSKGTDIETVQSWKSAADSMKKDGTFERIARKWAKLISERDGVSVSFSDGVLSF